MYRLLVCLVLLATVRSLKLPADFFSNPVRPYREYATEMLKVARMEWKPISVFPDHTLSCLKRNGSKPNARSINCKRPE